MLSLLCLTIVFMAKADQGADNQRYRRLRATPDTSEKLTSLAEYLQEKTVEGVVDVWKLSRNLGSDVTFALPDGEIEVTADWLRSRNINFQFDDKDLERLVQEDFQRERLVSLTKRGGNSNLNSYIDHAQMNEYLQEVAESCNICKIINIGQSHEGRDMDVIMIGHFGNNKTAIWLDAGIHAREWIAPAAALNIINYIVEGYKSNDPDITWLLHNYVWFILPSANPDGYEYSRTELEDQYRFWRKTRRSNGQFECIGTDPNRNWNPHWAESGTSPDPCSPVFPGPQAFSEVETQNIRNFLIRRKHLFCAYVSLHNYGQYWLYPWGYTANLPEDWEELDRVGRRAVDKIYQVHQKVYTLGNAGGVMYFASGITMDWAKSVANIKYSYTVELRDRGDYGFLLPSEQIQPTSEEVWAGLLEMARAIKDI